MSKTCLNRLSGNILTDCTLRTHGIKDIYLIYFEDVKLTLSSGTTTVESAEWGSSPGVLRIEGYKQNIQVTTSAISTDASTRLDVSIQFKASLSTLLARRIPAGRFFVLTIPNSGSNTLWGVQAPLQCSNIEYDSNANGGLATYTLSAPEGTAGNYPVLASEEFSKSVISKTV